MQRNFQRSLTAVLQHEGGYANHPKDPGGATNLGVTIGTAKRLGIDVDGGGDTDLVDIKLLKPSDAAKVYKAEYWDKVRGDELPDGVDFAVFDFAVNSGPSRAAKYLQGVVGAEQDGEIGPATLTRVSATGRVQVINSLCTKRMAFLEALPTFKTFGKGWTRRVSGVRKLALEMAAGIPEPDRATIPLPTPPIPVSTYGEPVEHETPDAPVRTDPPKHWFAVLIDALISIFTKR